MAGQKGGLVEDMGHCIFLYLKQGWVQMQDGVRLGS